MMRIMGRKGLRSNLVESHQTTLLMMEDDDDEELGSPMSDSPLSSIAGNADPTTSGDVTDRVKAWEAFTRRPERQGGVYRASDDSEKKVVKDNGLVLGMLFTGEIDNNTVFGTMDEFSRTGSMYRRRKSSAASKKKLKEKRRSDKKSKGDSKHTKSTLSRKNKKGNLEKVLMTSSEKPASDSKASRKAEDRNLRDSLPEKRNRYSRRSANTATKSQQSVVPDSGRVSSPIVDSPNSMTSSQSVGASGKTKEVLKEHQAFSDDASAGESSISLRRKERSPKAKNGKRNKKYKKSTTSTGFKDISLSSLPRKSDAGVVEPHFLPSALHGRYKNEIINITETDTTAGENQGKREQNLTISMNLQSAEPKESRKVLPTSSISSSEGNELQVEKLTDDDSLTGLGTEIMSPPHSSEDEAEVQDQRQTGVTADLVPKKNEVFVQKVRFPGMRERLADSSSETDHVDAARGVAVAETAVNERHERFSKTTNSRDQVSGPTKKDAEENSIHVANVEAENNKVSEVELSTRFTDRKGAAPGEDEIVGRSPYEQSAGDEITPVQTVVQSRAPRVCAGTGGRARALVPSETEMSLSGLQDEEVQVDWRAWEKTGGQKNRAERIAEKHINPTRRRRQIIESDIKRQQRVSIDPAEESLFIKTYLTKEKRRNIWSVNSGHTTKPKHPLKRGAERLSGAFRNALTFNRGRKRGVSV